MKTLIIKMFFVLFLFASYSQAQNWLQNYDGIPIITGFEWKWFGKHHPDDVRKMRDSAGVEGVTLDITSTDLMDTISSNQSYGFNLKVIPVRSPDPNSSTNVLNWIQHYTDAKYSVWEAEGTNPIKGNATLYRSQSKTEIDPTNHFITIKPSAVNDTCTMIWGPYYPQDSYYYAVHGVTPDTLVRYRADFRMKLEYNYNNPNIEDNPNDTICHIQVTQSSVSTTGGWHIDCTYPIADSVITRQKFTQLNQFLTLRIENYNLLADDCQGSLDSPEPVYPEIIHRKVELPEGPRKGRGYIEFKVIWKGNPNYLLSIDKVTLSDERGRQLKGIVPSTALQDIADQAENSLLGYEDYIPGWLGIDEPHSIDIFEPIRIVKEILDSVSGYQRPLWIPFMGGINYWNHENDFGVYHLNKWEEFKKRVGDINIIQNYYMFDAPCWPGRNIGYCNSYDYRDRNIFTAAEYNYKAARQLDPNFGVSIQCGSVYNTQAHERDVRSHEVLYNVNLALMYGAKFFHLYPYFAQRSINDTGWTVRGVVEWENFDSLLYTDKYYTIRDTISPRLKGLFGKTIKKLEPASLKFLGKDILIDPDYSSYYSYIDFIEAEGSQYDTCIVDLGLFTDPEDYSSRYFMTINRYYSTFGNMTIGLKDLSTYKNWQITDLMDTSGVSLVAYNNKFEFNDTIIPGDAKLYNVLPVVRKGGTIAENDTVFYNTTLTDDMLINSAKSVYIKPGMFYTIQDTITLQGSGSTITGEGYLEVAQGGEVIIYNWTNSLFKGKQSDHPKLFWGKFTGTGHTGYKIYRKKETLSFMEIASLSDSARTFTDTTVTIIEGQSQANEVEAEYYVKAIYNNGRSSINSNTINYKRVEGSGQEKINTGLTRDNFTYQLQQNYPNPFNPVTQISYSIENDGLVELEVLNILGERVASLVNEFKTKGSYTIPFDASQLSSGIYIYRLRSKDFVSSKKMLLLK